MRWDLRGQPAARGAQPTHMTPHTGPAQCIFPSGHGGAGGGAACTLLVGSRVLLPGAAESVAAPPSPSQQVHPVVPELSWPRGAAQFCSKAALSTEPGCWAQSRQSPTQGPGTLSTVSWAATPEPRCRPLPPGPP